MRYEKQLELSRSGTLETDVKEVEFERRNWPAVKGGYDINRKAEGECFRL